MRPVCEMQFADFVACGFDQLVNVAGKLHYRLGLAAPIVVRLPSGGGFCRRPVPLAEPRGLVHARARAEGPRARRPPHDAKGLLHRGDRTTPTRSCFLEHKHLYRRVSGEVPEGAYETPMRARVARAGRRSRRDRLRGDGARGARGRPSDRRRRSVAVLDLRSLVPLDEEAILDAVARCSKVVIVDEANYTCAAGAQVASLIAEHGFEDLDGPVVRVATPDVPIPFSPPLEQAVLPSVERIREACRELLAY